MAGSGHSPQAREPVRINLLIRDFAARCNGGPPPAPRWTRARPRTRRALIVTSPIGLGHAWRDVRIAQALRRRVPGIAIEWLAQDPVTRVLEAHGEAIHPASAELAPEAAHIDRESGEFELHAFQAMRRMDEILCANFMLFHDVVQDGRYDLWVGDEAWEVDYFLHENPELKTAAYAWMADFVGFVPLPAGGEREAAQAIDMNAQMIEHIERFGHVRDRSLFVGDPEDVIPGRFGPGLPEIRAWTQEHYQFVGSITACDPDAPPDREAIRASLGVGARRARLRRRRRRLRRRRIAPAAPRRRGAGGAGAGTRAAPRARDRPAHRSGHARCAGRASTCSATSTASTGSWRPATRRSCRAG